MNQELLSKEECRKTEVGILKVVHEICEKNNLKYFICDGTLLGAVRHQGFIPWDDDIDIMLLREEYNKLICILKKQTEYKWLEILDFEKKGYYYTFAKVVDNRTVAKMDDNMTEQGLWVDIFPYDNVPDDEKNRKRFAMKNYFKRSIIMSMATDFSAEKKIKHKYIKKVLYIYSKLLNKENFIKRYNKFEQKYNKQDTKYVGNLFSPYGPKECFLKEIFNERKKYKFENEYFYGPEKADEYLSQLYGKYMELPPENERRDHKIIAWKKEQN